MTLVAAMIFTRLLTWRLVNGWGLKGFIILFAVLSCANEEVITKRKAEKLNMALTVQECPAKGGTTEVDLFTEVWLIKNKNSPIAVYLNTKNMGLLI